MIAIVVGGAECVDLDLDEARALVGDRPVVWFAVNDQIARFPERCHAVTLHPAWLPTWLKARADARLPAPCRTWAHKEHEMVTDRVDDWGGSVGLMGVAAARACAHECILLCGVPMTRAGGHFIRRRPWVAATAFQGEWKRRKQRIAPYVRSFSGWTREFLGEPTLEFLGTTGCKPLDPVP